MSESNKIIGKLVKNAIERCNELIKPEHTNWIGISNQVAIETVLNLIQKQKMVIDEMAKELMREYTSYEPCYLYDNIEDCIEENCKYCIKQYFFRKVEENE